MSDTTPDTVWDYLIQGAKVFDGIGELPVREDIARWQGRSTRAGP